MLLALMIIFIMLKEEEAVVDKQTTAENLSALQDPSPTMPLRVRTLQVTPTPPVKPPKPSKPLMGRWTE